MLWHRPQHGARLTSLLEGLGLGTAASKNTDFEGVAGASEQKTQRSRRQQRSPKRLPPPSRGGSVASAGRSAGWSGARC